MSENRNTYPDSQNNDFIDFSNVTDEEQNLIPITMRLTPRCNQVLEELSSEFETSKAEVCRNIMAGKLNIYKRNTHYVNVNDGKVIKAEVHKIGTELEKIKNEINHIGVNYNQEIHLRNANAKSGKSVSTEKLGESCIKKIEVLIDRYEDLMKETGKLLCTLI